MRKRSNRKIRPVSSLITPSQHENLMLLPRMHWTLMQTHAPNEIYQQSVLGVFNIAVALSHLLRHAELQRQFQDALTLLVAIIEQARLPNESEVAFLNTCFNKAETTIGIQSKASLTRAIEYIDKQIAEGKGVPARRSGEDVQSS